MYCSGILLYRKTVFTLGAVGFFFWFDNNSNFLRSYDIINYINLQLTCQTHVRTGLCRLYSHAPNKGYIIVIVMIMASPSYVQNMIIICKLKIHHIGTKQNKTKHK